MGSYGDRIHFFPEGATALRSQCAMRFPPPALPKPNVSRVFKGFQEIIFAPNFGLIGFEFLSNAGQVEIARDKARAWSR